MWAGNEKAHFDCSPFKKSPHKMVLANFVPPKEGYQLETLVHRLRVVVPIISYELQLSTDRRSRELWKLIRLRLRYDLFNSFPLTRLNFLPFSDCNETEISGRNYPLKSEWCVKVQELYFKRFVCFFLLLCKWQDTLSLLSCNRHFVRGNLFNWYLPFKSNAVCCQ